MPTTPNQTSRAGLARSRVHETYPETAVRESAAKLDAATAAARAVDFAPGSAEVNALEETRCIAVGTLVFLAEQIAAGQYRIAKVEDSR